MKTFQLFFGALFAMVAMALPICAQTLTTLVVDSGNVGTHLSHAVVNGNPAICYRDMTNYTLKYVRATNASGTSWGVPVTISSASSISHASLAIVNGNPAISFHNGNDATMRFVRATDVDGTAWGTTVYVDLSVGGTYTSLTVVGGRPAISYYTGSDLRFIRAVTTTGTTWPSNGVTLDSTGTVGQYTSLAVVNGNPAISYYDATNGDLKYTRANNNIDLAWTAPVTIDSAGVVGLYTSMAIVNGNPAIAYYDQTNGDLKYTRASNVNGTAWSTPLTIDGTGNVGQYTSLKVINGAPAIAYYDVTNTNVKYVRATDPSGTLWGTPVIFDDVGSVGEYASLAAVYGAPAVAYYAAGDLKWTTQSFAPGPDIVVSGGGVGIVSGDTIPAAEDLTDFGDSAVSGGTVVRTFSLTNLGIDPLNLAGTAPDYVTITGSSDFTVTAQPAATVAAADTVTFQVTFNPSAFGLCTATLNIASDDADESAYTFSIQGAGINAAPTNITLSPASIAENNALDATVGTLTATDPDVTDAHSFTLVTGTGDTDNGLFTVTGDSLILKPSADHETKDSYSVRLRATDDGIGNLTFEKAITVTIANVNEMPGFTKGADQSLPAATAAAQTVANWATAITDGDSTAVQALSFSITGNTNPGLFATPPAIASNGTLTYTPNGAAGTATISVTLTDDASINGNAALTTAAQTFTITVAAALPAPRTYHFTATVSDNGSVNDADVANGDVFYFEYSYDANQVDTDGRTTHGQFPNAGLSLQVRGAAANSGAWSPNTSTATFTDRSCATQAGAFNCAWGIGGLPTMTATGHGPSSFSLVHLISVNDSGAGQTLEQQIGNPITITNPATDLVIQMLVGGTTVTFQVTHFSTGPHTAVPDVYLPFELSETSSYYNNEPDSGTDSSSFATSPVRPPFQANFAALGDTVVTLHFRAPPGQRFKVSAPTGWQALFLNCGFSGGTSLNFANAHRDSAALWSFDKPAGDVPTASGVQFNLTGPGGDGFGITVGFNIHAGDVFTCEGFRITTTVPTGYDINFDVPTYAYFAALASGPYNTPDAGPWLILEPVASPEPEIAVEQPVGTDISDGGSKDVGTSTVGVAASPVAFTIRNTGAGDLTLGTFTKDGANPADFAVSIPGNMTVPPGGSTTFTVTFTPGGGGSRSAVLHIPCNDADENPFDITITGTGTLVGGSIAFSAATYTVNQEATTVGLTLTRAGGSSPVSVTLNTDNGLSIKVPPFTAAKAGVDYTDLAGAATTVAFAENEMSKTISVLLVPKTGTQIPNRQFTATISNPGGGATLGAIVTSTIRILAADTLPPSLTITKPAPPTAKVPVPMLSTVSPCLINGVAGDARGLDRIEVSLNGAPPVPAILGAANVATSVPWSLLIQPQEGSNTLAVTARDLRGNTTTLTRTFTFTRRYSLSVVRSVPASMAATPDAVGLVTITGTPTTGVAAFTPVTANANPKTSHIIPGTLVKLTAMPKPGYIFSHWTHSFAANDQGNIISFAMPAADMTASPLTAHFVANSFFGEPGASNTFYGHIHNVDPGAATNATEGFLTCTVVPGTGSCSGKVSINGLTKSFSALLFGDGSSAFLSGATRQRHLMLGDKTFTLGFADGTPHCLISGGGQSSSGIAYRGHYSTTRKVPAGLLNQTVPATAPAPNKGFYTMALPAKEQSPAVDPAVYPQGTGFATITLSNNGTLTFTGTLADGATITGSSGIVGGGKCPIFSQITTPGAAAAVKHGSLGGTLFFDSAQPGSDVSATDLLWFRPTVSPVLSPAAAAAATNLYTAGWPNGIRVDAVGALYDKTVSVQTGIGLPAPHAANGNGELILTGGKLTADITKTSFNITGNLVTKTPAPVKADASYTLTFTAATGGFSGSFTPNWSNPNTAKPAFKGILIQKGASKGGFGFFISNAKSDLDPESGGVTLHAP